MQGKAAGIVESVKLVAGNGIHLPEFDHAATRSSLAFDINTIRKTGMRDDECFFLSMQNRAVGLPPSVFHLPAIVI